MWFIVRLCMARARLQHRDHRAPRAMVAAVVCRSHQVHQVRLDRQGLLLRLQPEEEEVAAVAAVALFGSILDSWIVHSLIAATLQHGEFGR